jgi:hypothetical protein
MQWVNKVALWGKNTWVEYSSKFLLGLAFILVATLSFEAGLLQKSLGENTEPVIIRVAESALVSNVSTSVESSLAKDPSTLSETPNQSSTAVAAGCQLVGSKNSNKYHHPASRCAKQIKPENKRCFASVEDAKARGYLPGCLEP